MLREGVSKSKPRETYIIDSLPSPECQYFLIRKLSQSLRPKLYKALAQELMPAPHVEFTRNNIRPPPRKSAIKATENLKLCLAIKSYQNRKQLITQSRFKHGWNEEDQNMDFELHPFITPAQMDFPQEEFSPAIPEPGTETYNLPSSPNSNCSSADLSWDDSDLTYLSTPPNQEENPPKPYTVTTSTPFTKTNPESIKPFTRSRLFASTDPMLSRTPAFRQNASDQAFLEPPSPPVLPPQPIAPKKKIKSRIPKPLSPSQVVPEQVTNLSQVLPRRSSRPSQPPPRYDPTNQPGANAERRREGEMIRRQREQEMFRKHQL